MQFNLSSNNTLYAIKTNLKLLIIKVFTCLMKQQDSLIFYGWLEVLNEIKLKALFEHTESFLSLSLVYKKSFII